MIVPMMPQQPRGAAAAQRVMTDKMMVGRGGGYGLDAELALKAAAKYDFEGERTAQEWMEAVTGVKFEGSFASSLKDGTLLCQLINAIKPGTIKRINSSKMPFKQMENISNFLKACRTLGVAEYSLFETVDLFEEKDVGLVIRCLFALGSAVQSSTPEFAGPHLGAKPHTANKREFTAEQMRQARLDTTMTKAMQGSAAVMERLPIVKTGITAGAEYAGIGDTSSMCMTSMGSYGIMDRSEVVRTGITMGADSAGPSADANAVPHSSMGSAGIMERSTIVKTGITSGADYAGPSVDANMVAQANLGSYGIMERKEVPASGITMGADMCGPSADANAVPLTGMGSGGIMERSENRSGFTGITLNADHGGSAVLPPPPAAAAAAAVPPPAAEAAPAAEAEPAAMLSTPAASATAAAAAAEELSSAVAALSTADDGAAAAAAAGDAGADAAAPLDAAEENGAPVKAAAAAAAEEEEPLSSAADAAPPAPAAVATSWDKGAALAFWDK